MTRKRKRAKDLKRNVQLEKCLIWLRAMKVVKNAKHLAKIMECSEATLSAYLTMQRTVSAEFVYTLEEKILLKQKPPCRLQDFELDVLVRQTQQMQKQDSIDMMELLTTQTTWVEGGVRTILDKLDKLEQQNSKILKAIGELQRRRSS